MDVMNHKYYGYGCNHLVYTIRKANSSVDKEWQFLFDVIWFRTPGKGEFMTKENENLKPHSEKSQTQKERTLKTDRENRNYKDSLFRFIFSDKQKLLELYNALNHSHYENVDDLEINTLENVIYLKMKNDLSFVFHLGLYLFEHQSTLCPNMPLRDLQYVAILLEGMIPKDYIYSRKLVKIPTPHFVVFYNGVEEMEERTTLRLSDAFLQEEEEPQLELIVTVLNINYGKNKELMDACKDLRDSSIYVQKVREYSKTMDISEAVEKAIEECIKNDVLKDLLTKFRAEVKHMSLTEYDEELHERVLREESREEGMEKGMEKGEMKTLLFLVNKKVSKGKSTEEIAEELELDIFTVEMICDVIETAPSDFTQEELLETLLERKQGKKE